MRSAAVGELFVSFILFWAGCSEVGETCEQNGDCGGDLVCHRAVLADGSLSTSGVCGYSRLQRGEVCAFTAECNSGLFCSNDLPSTVKERYGTCIDVLPEGEACFRDENCASGLVCEKAEDAETGTCQVAMPVDAGADGPPLTAN